MLKDIFVNMDWEEKCVMWGHQRGGGGKAKKKRKEILLKETRFELITLMAQMLENLPTMQETQVPSLGWEDSPGVGNGNPLQYSSLENPMDRGAGWATVHRVTKSQTQLSD